VCSSDLKLYLKDNPAVLAEIEVKVKDLLGMKAVAGAGEEEAVLEE
jgi:hypothetical protein